MQQGDQTRKRIVTPPTAAGNGRRQDVESPWLAELGRDWRPVSPEQVRPRSVTIDLTHACPFHCPGCIEQFAMRQSRHGHLTLETVRRFLTTFVHQGGRHLLLYGGEPTCAPTFPEVVAFAAPRVYSITVVTNGAYLGNAPVLDALRSAEEHTRIKVRVSLNAGTAATHARVHGVAGWFDRVVEGMRAFSSTCPRSRLEVSFLAEDANAHEVEAAYAIARSVNATSLAVRPMTGASGSGLVELRPAARRALLGVLERHAARHSATATQLVAPEWFPAYLRGDGLPDTTKPPRRCYFCAASRLVLSPPDPGVVWSCTYHRGDPRYLVADLKDVVYGSPEFEARRIAAQFRIFPAVDCREVICNRAAVNRTAWALLEAQGQPCAVAAE